MSNSTTQTFNKEWYNFLPTSQQVDRLARFLPVPRRPPKVSTQYLIGALRYQNTTNCAWRQLPREFGNPKTIYNRLLDWSRKGILSKAFETISFEKADFSRFDIDTTFGKCKRTALSFRSDGQDRCCGVSKGGSTTKLHALSDAKGRIVYTDITQGQRSDIKGLRDMYPKLRDISHRCRTCNITCYLNGDKAYDSDKDRECLMFMGFNPIILYRDIKTKDGKKKGPTCPKELPHKEREIYKKRHYIENAFGKLKDAEAIAFRKSRTTKMYKQSIDCEVLFRFWL